ncbi:MAG: DUF2877 domain-containing protein [Deltaproteobacteria bacterium]|nr:DUF2877 domain-containing protein [Deltaproteobacteria bacterium]
MIVIARFDRALARPWRGCVEASWRDAALVRPAEDDDGAITLLAPGRGLVANGVEVPWDAPPAPGTAVLVGQRSIRVGDRSWRLAGPGVDLTLDDVARDCAALRRHLAILVTPSPAVPEAAVRLRSLASWLFGADRPGEPEAAVKGLVGLGPGLTPTGDDVLTGALAAAHWISGAVEGDRLLYLGLAVLGAGADSTTPVGRAMLRYAAAGRFPEPLVRLVRALGDPEADAGDVRLAFVAVVAVGARSGNDMLAGLLATLLAAREGGN